MNIIGHIKEHAALGYPTKPFGVQAESYGANPSATAAANTAAIQLALDETGLVTLTNPGVYNINKTLFIPENTHFYVGPGVTIFLEASANCDIIRNSQSAALLNNNQLSRTLTTVTVTDYGHNKVVGDYVLVASGKGTDATYVGEYQVVSVSGNTWTYTTATSGAPATPTNWLWIHHNYERLAYTAFSGDGTTVTVTEASHKRRIGDPVWVNGITPTSGVFDGLYEVTAVTSTTWSYTATGQTPTAGTAKVVGQNNITVTIDGLLDGNTANQSGFSNNENAVHFQCVGNCEVSGNVANLGIHGVQLAAVTDFRAPYLNLRSSNVGVQLEGFWNRVSLNDITHQGSDDCVAFTHTSTTGSGTDYSHTSSPFGIRNSDNAFVKNIKGATSLCMIKVSGSATYSLGSMVFDGVYGEVAGASATPIRIIDDSYLVGGAATSIIIKNFDVDQPSTRGLMLLNMSGGIGYFEINNIVIPACNGFAIMQTATGASAAGTITRCKIEGIYQKAACNTTNWLSIGGGGVAGFTITDLEINSGNPNCTSAQSFVRLGDTTTRVDRIHSRGLRITSAGDRNSVVFNQNTGKIAEIKLWDYSDTGMSNLFANATGATAVTSAIGISLQLNNVQRYHSLAVTDTNVALIYNVMLSNVYFANASNATYVIKGAAGTFRVTVNGLRNVNEANNQDWGFTAAGNNFLAATAGTAVASINGMECPIDPAAYGTGGIMTLTPILGDRIWNSNSAIAPGIGAVEWDGTYWRRLDNKPHRQTLTASGAVLATVQELTLNHTTVAIAATISTAVAHAGLFTAKSITEPGAGQDHTLVITTGTFDGTNKTATFQDINDSLTVWFDTAGNGTVINNTGVTLSA